jgi:hypothetical protein
VEYSLGSLVSDEPPGGIFVIVRHIDAYWKAIAVQLSLLLCTALVFKESHSN